MKLFTKTFGCQMNFADSDEMTREFRKRGFSAADTEENADAILVNTCTVRDLAEHKASSFIGTLKDWKQSHPEGMIVVTGCAAERAKEEFKKRFPHIDLIVGAKDITEFPTELDGLLSRHPGISQSGIQFKMGSGLKISSATDEESLLPQTASSVVQYVTIMRGCNYNCSYCIVPSVRGREVYRGVDEILKDVADRVNEGAKEIWLLGQTVNSYRPSNSPKVGYDFADLLGDVAQVPGAERIRFISPHPYYMSDKLIDTMASHRAICEHIHLPVQSGSNEMLRKMKRNYTREIYMKGIAALRRAIPNIAISTDIIVGFPGEKDSDYQQTLSLVKEANFDSAYCFKYSPRPGTLSAEWNDDVPEPVKEERVNELLALTDAQGTAKAAALIGTEQEVLLEQEKGNAVMRGKTRGAWRVRVKSDSLKLGETINVKITGTHSRELHAELGARN